MKGHKLRGENIAFFYMSILLDALLTIEPSSLDCPDKIAVDIPVISDFPEIVSSPALNATLSHNDNNKNKERIEEGNSSSNGSRSDEQYNTTSTSTSSLIFINGTTSNTTSNSTSFMLSSLSSTQSERSLMKSRREKSLFDFIIQNTNATRRNSHISSQVNREDSSNSNSNTKNKNHLILTHENSHVRTERTSNQTRKMQGRNLEGSTSPLNLEVME